MFQEQMFRESDFCQIVDSWRFHNDELNSGIILFIHCTWKPFSINLLASKFEKKRILISISRTYLWISLFFLVPCVWGPWSKFSQCDRSCGGGKMYKTRTKLEPAKYGGTCPGVAKVIKNCNTHECPSKCLFK